MFVAAPGMVSSSKPCTGPVVVGGRAVITLADAPNTGALPLDAVHEILLRLPARALCRLRAVCRLWRSLLSSDPGFAAAHAARHREPLVVAGYANLTDDSDVLFDIIDLSGRVVKRVRGAAGLVVAARLDLVCIAKGTACLSYTLLDPATGSARALPEALAEEHAGHERNITRRNHGAMVALGQVSSTGERKVLRVLDFFPNNTGWQQIYEIVTLDGSGSTSGHARRWRKVVDPPHSVRSWGAWASAAIDDVVCFFSNEIVANNGALPDIASFDLGTEQWRPTIRGPLGSLADDDDHAIAADVLPNNHMELGEFSLAVLDGCLVVAHRTAPSPMDLWFLVDVENCKWVKKYTVQARISFLNAEHTVRPLLMLDDGRIVFIHVGNRGVLKIYDPVTESSTDVAEMGPCVAVGLYTGNILSLTNCAS